MNYTIGRQTPNHGKLITPELFVYHSTEGGSKSYLDSLFSGQVGRGDGVNVSVHFAAYKDGSIVAYASWKRGEAVACWHAGQSMWDGVGSCNYHSLGVEIQHAAGETYPEAQINAVVGLTRMIRAEYPGIQLVTHAQIAWPRGRKSDPTAPWATQVWPRIQAGLTEQEDDMTADERQMLAQCIALGKQARVSDVARSHDMEIIKAMVAGETPERIDALEAQKAAGVRHIRKELGLEGIG